MRFVNKKINKRIPFVKVAHAVKVKAKDTDDNTPTITEIQTEEVMASTQEKIEAAREILAPKVKKIRKDRGLIERAESSTTIITEDNKELLTD